MNVEVSRSTLHMVPSLPASGEGDCAFYGDEPVPAGWRSIDVRARCHAHQDEWGQALKAWHGQMMTVAAAATPWAWFLSGSRQHVWHPPIRPLLFALALVDHFREHRGAVLWAVGAPAEVGDYVTELSRGTVDVIGRGAVSADAGAWSDLARPAMEALSVLRRAMTPRAPRLSAGPVDLVVCSIALTSRSVRERGDHYFGRALDGGPLRVHWLYQPAGSSFRTEIEGAMAESGRSFTWADECLNWRDAIAIIRTSIRTRRRLAAIMDEIPPLVIAGATSRLFARRFFEQLLVKVSPRTELIMHLAVTKVLAALRPAAVCYPYEEKPVEHAILAAAATAGCRTIGFAHAAYASSYLYLQAAEPGALSPPRPSVLACAGRGFGGWLERTFARTDRTVYVGSPRWTPPPSSSIAHTPARPLRVLVLTSFPYELAVMADWMSENPGLFEGMDVTVRPNPSAWAQEQEAQFARLRKVGRVNVDGRTGLDAQVATTDVVLFCATSAAAEAIWHGRLAIYVEWSDLWITDPLKGKSGEHTVPRCQTAEMLRGALVDLSNMDAAGYAAALSAQREVAAEIYGPFDAAVFSNLVMERASV